MGANLIVDADSIINSFLPYVSKNTAYTLLLRLVYKAKMLQHPENVSILTKWSDLPFNGSHFTTDALSALSTYDSDITNAIIMSMNPTFLALSAYCKLAYRVSGDWLELEEIGLTKLKREVGHDPRDTGYFKRLGITNPDKGDKARAGRNRDERWAGYTQDTGVETLQLNTIADNIHIKVGRTGFSNYEIFQDVPSVLRLLDQSNEVGWDTETTGLDVRGDRVVGESFSIDGKRGYYLPILHDLEGKYVNVPYQEVIDRVHPVIANKGIYGANLSFDVLQTVDDGMGFPHDLRDVQGYAWMLGFHVPDPSALGLKALARDVLNDRMEEYDAVAKGQTFNTVSIEKAAPYAADDAVKSYRIGKALEAQLTADQLIRYNEIEKPFLRACIRMSYNGMYMNESKLQPLLAQFDSQLAKLERSIVQHAGGVFDVGSSQQLQKVLFGTLSLPPQRKTKTGYSTDKETLNKLLGKHPIIDELLTYRELRKLVDTYLVKYPDFIADDGRIHPRINPFRVISGRLSVQDPSLNTLPIRTDNGRLVRNLFEGEGDNLILAADAGQLEYRVLAHYTNNPRLIAAFNDPSRDIHKEMASIIFELDVGQITSIQRDIAKTCFYAIVYGAAVPKVASTIGESLSYTRDIMDKIMGSIPEILLLRQKVINEARKLGYVESHGGHRSHIQGINSPNHMIRSQAERAAFNTLFQGTASGDITKVVTIRTQEILDSMYPDFFNPDIKMIMQAHDEIVLEGDVSDDSHYLGAIGYLIEQEFANSINLSVPIVAGYKIGKSWGDVH